MAAILFFSSISSRGANSGYSALDRAEMQMIRSSARHCAIIDDTRTSSSKFNAGYAVSRATFVAAVGDAAAEKELLSPN